MSYTILYKRQDATAWQKLESIHYESKKDACNYLASLARQLVQYMPPDFTGALLLMDSRCKRVDSWQVSARGACPCL